MTQLHCEHAWLGGASAAASVVIDVDSGVITALTVLEGEAPPRGATRLRGIVLPGLANVHSHAFHRALRGSSQSGAGDFWTWRRSMYEVAASLDPEAYLRLARATYGEMALAGITAVGEFHYVHHDRGGGRYADPNEMAHALVQAAREAGIRICLIDACYLRSGFDGDDLDPVQRRFADADTDEWAARVDRLAAAYRGDPGVVVGAAAHSVRAVDGPSIGAVAAAARRDARPFHIHLSEQRAENDACVVSTGGSPTSLLDACGALDERTVAVHATHLTGDDVATIGARSSHVCFCPTTERDLGDGIGPARALVDAGASLCLGSDSHAVIDLLEEARAVELNERLAREVRGVFEPSSLLAAGSRNGFRALGMRGGVLEVGAPADLVVLATNSVRMAGFGPGQAAAHIVAAGSAADVTDVMVGGNWVVRDRHHAQVSVADELHGAIRAVHP